MVGVATLDDVRDERGVALVADLVLAKDDEKMACSAGDARGLVKVVVVGVRGVVFIMASLASRNFASREVRSKQSLYAIRRNDNSP